MTYSSVSQVPKSKGATLFADYAVVSARVTELLKGNCTTRMQRNAETLLAVVQRRKLYLFMAPHNQHTFTELATVISDRSCSLEYFRFICFTRF